MTCSSPVIPCGKVFSDSCDMSGLLQSKNENKVFINVYHRKKVYAVYAFIMSAAPPLVEFFG